MFARARDPAQLERALASFTQAYAKEALTPIREAIEQTEYYQTWLRVNQMQQQQPAPSPKP